MSKLTDIIKKKSTKSNMPSDVLKVLKDFESNQNNQSYKSSGYLYYNSDFYIELMLLIGLFFLNKNRSSKEMYQLSDYKIGDVVYYKKKNYVFMGISDNDIADTVKLSLTTKSRKNNRNREIVEFIPTALFLKESKKITAPKKRKYSPIDKLINTYLGIDNPNNKINYQTIILTEKKNIEALNQVEFDIRGEYHKFASIVTSEYLTATGKQSYLGHTNLTRKPILIFTSDIIQAIELVENYSATAYLQVVVLGSKWFKYKQSQNLSDLIEVCKDRQVLITLYSAVFSIFAQKAISNLRKLDNTYSWLNPPSNLIEPRIDFKFISTNENLSENVFKLLEILENIKHKAKNDYYYIPLVKKISSFINLSLAQIKGGTITLAQFRDNTLDTIKVLEGGLYEKTLVIFNEIYQNRYGYNVRKELDKIICTDEKVMIVVPNELIEETISIIADKINVEVRSYNERITSRMYFTFNKIILINPKPFERRRWVLSNLASQIVVIYPDIFLDIYKKSLTADKNYIEELIKLNGEEVRVVVPYLDALNRTIKMIKNKRKQLNLDENIISEVIDEKNEEMFSGNESVLKEYYENYLMELEQLNYEYNNKHDGNQKVTVSFEIVLQNGYIFGTENAKLNVVNSDNYIEQKEIDDIELGDIIIEFYIPYSDEGYRSELKELYDGEITSNAMLELDDGIFFDYYWKDELLRYLEKNSIKPIQFKKEIEGKGFEEKSISFYSVWSDINKIPIAPQNPKFILKVGEMLDNQKIIDNYLDYFEASKYVRRMLSGDREEYISSLIGKKLESVVIEGHRKEIVLSIDEIEISNVSRRVTNKIWEVKM